MDDVKTQVDYEALYAKQMSELAAQAFRQRTAEFFRPFYRKNHFQRAMDCTSEIAMAASYTGEKKAA